ncbi:transcriptional regulator [Salinigranum salinum]|uniref:transcriptional regulator n=1 Tax=Salinigranum salinum TaxID=1364937 RepID=UPI00126111E2|nr:transcriptional regulator [Salinigranum salinum]
MAELNAVAKRMYNVTPDRLRLSLDDGTTGVFELSSAEFFQQTFQAEGRRIDGDAAAYRFTTDDDNAAVLAGRQTDDGGWTLVGEVVTAERADAGTGDATEETTDDATDGVR